MTLSGLRSKTVLTPYDALEIDEHPLNNVPVGDLEHFLFQMRKNEKLFFIATKKAASTPNLMATQLHYLFHNAAIPSIMFDECHISHPTILERYYNLPTSGVLYMTKNGQFAPLHQKALRAVWSSIHGFMDRNYRLLKERYSNHLQPLAEIHENRKVVEMLQFKIYKKINAFTYELAARTLISTSIFKRYPDFDNTFPLVFDRAEQAFQRKRDFAADKKRIRAACFKNGLFIKKY